MSFWGVTKEKIEKIRKHTNADTLEIVKLKGLNVQVIAKIGEWKVGDECVYFPVDSLFSSDLLSKLGFMDTKQDGDKTIVKGKLSGKEGNILKTIKLRGEISQGLIFPISIVPDDIWLKSKTPKDIADYLGVTKYEPPEIFLSDSSLYKLPENFGVYDIESAERYPQVIDYLMNLPVCITEKVEGTNFSVYSNCDGDLRVNQRKWSIRAVDKSKNSFWIVAEKYNLLRIVESVRKFYGAKACSIYGEFIGPKIQKNIYQLQFHNVLIFDIKLLFNSDGDGDIVKFLDWNDFKFITRYFKINTVPVLQENIKLKNILGEKSISEYSNGKSKLFNIKREGIVIKPTKEEYSEILKGRLIIKQRSPEYLSKSKL